MLIRDYSNYKNRRSVAAGTTEGADAPKAQQDDKAMDDLQPSPTISGKMTGEPPVINTASEEHPLDCLFEDGIFDDSANLLPGSTGLKTVLGRRNIQVAAVCALSLIACGSFAAMSFFQSVKPSHPVEVAAAPMEPIAMLGVEGMVDMKDQAKAAVEKTNQALKGGENDASADSAATSKTMPDGTEASDEDMEKGLIPVAYEPSGRPDPFAPLVGETAPGGAMMGPDGQPVEKDVMDSLQYVGFIGDMNAKDKVAMIKVSDSILGAKTLIKKAGDTFTVDGKALTLKSISKNQLQLKVKGQTRSLMLSATEDSSAASGDTAASGLDNLKKLGSSKAPDVDLQEP